ncbi:hypothetical protein NHX12_026667 [Muraenolepis orangiensis]|uniref:Reverse transcriptase domain-containing protein n=1 Tax=Muraenolepis orangiensis TaxID=630683 RepID=A0A9Q0IQZ0_9TELE|nr:hypothetical protein NHX12_026667 [Muraenolepis orangiensis]
MRVRVELVGMRMKMVGTVRVEVEVVGMVRVEVVGMVGMVRMKMVGTVRVEMVMRVVMVEVVRVEVEVVGMVRAEVVRTVRVEVVRTVWVEVVRTVWVEVVRMDEIEGSSFKDAVFTSVELDKGDKLLVGCIYRSPNSSVETNNALNSLMRKVGDKYYSHVLITGDFNYPGVNWVDWTTKGESTEAADYKLIEACRDSYHHQHVMNPTRGRNGNQPNLLDLVLTNEEDMVASVTHLGALGASDHCVLLHDLNCYVTLTPTAHTRYVYDKGDYAKLREILDHDWDEVFHDCKDDIEQQYELFLDHYNATVDECIPRKTFTNIGSQGRTPLDQNTLRRRVRKKHRTWQRFMETRQGEEHRKYCREHNWVRHLTRKLKKAYEKSIAQQSKANPKKFWRYVKSKTKTRSVMPDLISPATGEKISGDLERAELLGLYFSSVFTQEPPGEIPRLPHLQLTTLLERLDISTDMVYKKLQNLNTSKSPGPDSVSPRVLHEAAPSLAKPLAHIFQTSLRSKKLPEKWMKATISAIFKKGDKQIPANYRPVSLTSILCKIMESILRDKIVDFLKENDLLSHKQYGFISGRSTSLQLLKVLDDWTDIIDRGGQIDCIVCDFMKAFDKVPHRRLIGKVETYGIRDSIKGWLEDFLKDRSQQVVVNGVKSTPMAVTSGNKLYCIVLY